MFLHFVEDFTKIGRQDFFLDTFEVKHFSFGFIPSGTIGNEKVENLMISVWIKNENGKGFIEITGDKELGICFLKEFFSPSNSHPDYRFQKSDPILCKRAGYITPA